MSRLIDYIEGREEYFEEKFLYDLFKEKLVPDKEPGYIPVSKLPHIFLKGSDYATKCVYDVTIIKDKEKQDLLLIDKVEKIIIVDRRTVYGNMYAIPYDEKRRAVYEDLFLDYLGEYKIILLDKLGEEIITFIEGTEKKLNDANLDTLSSYGEKLVLGPISDLRNHLLKELKVSYVLGYPLLEELKTEYIVLSQSKFKYYKQNLKTYFHIIHIQYLRCKDSLNDELEKAYNDTINSKDASFFHITAYKHMAKLELYNTYKDKIEEDDDLETQVNIVDFLSTCGKKVTINGDKYENVVALNNWSTGIEVGSATKECGLISINDINIIKFGKKVFSILEEA